MLPSHPFPLPSPLIRYRKFLQLHKEKSRVMLVPMMVRG